VDEQRGALILMPEIIEGVFGLLYFGFFSPNRAVRYSTRAIVVILVAGVVALVVANN
jgi:hypothetical protein